MAELLFVVGVALAASFLCSIMEAVLLSISHSYVVLLQKRGDRAGTLLARMRRDIDEPIAAILTLNTIAHTIGAAVGGALALQVFGSRWVAAFSVVLTLAVLLFSEIVPKTMGARHWKVLARPIAFLLRALIVVMKPFLVPLSWFSRLLQPGGRRGPTISRGELEVLAEIGRREGTLSEHEWLVMKRVINLERLNVGAIMTPRPRMVVVSVTAGMEEAREAILEGGYSRVPVYEEKIDNIVGVLRARDLWRAEVDGLTDVRAVMEPPRFVPESKSVAALMEEMRAERVKMSVVVDEFGGTAGLVTLEDILEGIVGELHEEREIGPPPIEEASQLEVRLDGTVPIHEVNNRLDLELSGSEHDTIAGYLLERLDRMPREGDTVATDEGEFLVLEMDGHRIARIAFRRPT